MNRNIVRAILVIVAITLTVAGCKTAPEVHKAPIPSVTSLKDFPDHGFNPKTYTQGMVKGGYRLLIWQDPGVDLSRYSSVRIAPFGGRLLPEQNRFSYTPFIKRFNRVFQDELKRQRGNDASTLRIIGELVACHPGSRAASFLVGAEAGKAFGAVACEVYLPDRPTPCLKLYIRDTASRSISSGYYGAHLNQIFSQIAKRLILKLDELQAI